MSKVYEIVTARVLEMMENGTAPWRKPWSSSVGNMRPCNIKGNQYRGGNYFLMAMLGDAIPVYLTFKQAQERGGSIRKGAKAIPVFFWNWAEVESANGDTAKVPFLRYYNVFNIADAENVTLPAKLTPEPAQTFNHDPIAAAQAVIDNMPNRPTFKVVEGSNKAFYRPQADEIQVPALNQYANPAEYYSTVFHELAHSTGHSSRLNRKEVMGANYFGSHDYSLEELVAELTAAMLCAEVGIDNDTIENSAAYLKGWMGKLKDDPKLFWMAAARAQKAADLILNRKAVEEVQEAA
jgi:antirestriction protein ArdC